jgi:hypothetical protein
MITYIACVAEKFTRKQISEVFEIEAYSVYHACDVLEQVSGITIDGVNNYADLCEMVEN